MGSFRFQLLYLFWFLSLYAASIAVFGAVGVVLASAVAVFWFLVLASEHPAHRIAQLLLTILVLFLLGVLMLPAVQSAREATRRVQCLNNVRWITIALLNYENVHGHLPPPYVADENGKPMHSWRVLILPFLEEEKLYNQYRFDEPWDGPNNVKLIPKMPSVYACPEHGLATAGFCHYSALVGDDTGWRVDPPMRLDELEVGAFKTVLVCETLRGFPWTKPSDLTPEQFIKTATELGLHDIQGGHVNEDFFTIRARVIHMGFADGRVERLIVPQKAHALKKLASRFEAFDPDLDHFEVLFQPRVKWDRVISSVILALLCVAPTFELLRRKWTRGKKLVNTSKSA